MGFLAPFAPLLIKGGIGLGASLLGSKLAGGQSKQEKSLIDSQNQNLKTQQDIADQSRTAGSNMLSLAGQSFNPVVDYYSRILSGDRGAMTSALGPDINRIGEGYRAAANTSASLMPRGGPRADSLSEMPFNQQRDISTLLQSARPGAAQGLFQAGNSAAGLGSNLISNSINALNGATSTGRSMLDFENQRKQQNQTLGMGIGKSIFDLLKNVNFKIGGNGNNSSGGGGGGGFGGIFGTGTEDV